METASTVITEFKTKFDPKDREHVTWMKKVQEAVATVNMNTTKSHLPKLINQNPMKVKLQADDMMDWVHIHFALAMIYTKAVLEGRACVPQENLRF